ncbi:hypothetical protein MYCTH_2127689 [Thermothelomyces thermophilus ATCC 42464]|uniref:Uncharacterized protein n=1 Tax=Thermothelomyces thermophilus (strain ATCC 42464 / BCRC 31852 / DSM 1799) TaxID=573729 RepID=G2QGX7_THET4|nr:uncharacterized protein MYCTH_2127689 [Thermothelomyces thermophilus ATCC 42464]AEO58637.1 hypothetical protein MYCTH_2127689 [Thermothelomyces thermophilus ATCC 42464]
MSFASYSFDGTVQAIPLVETNHQRALRPVFIKQRKLGGKRGKTLRAFSRFVLVPVVEIALILDDDDDDDDSDADYDDDDSDVSTVIDIGLAHWGVQVGDYLWELHTDRKHAKTLSMQRLTRSQIWRADVGEEEVGNTNMTDVEIDRAAHAALEKMKTKCGGKYSQVGNNCHDFTPRALWRASTAALKLVARAVTLPYYQLFRQMTLLPVRSIAASVRDGDDPEVIAKKLRLWRERKSAEFQIVQVAGTLLAAAVIGSFSWDGSQQPHWIGPAAWYCSLILSFSAVLLASSQASIFRAVSDSVSREHGFSLVQELALVMAVQRTEDDAELPLTRGLESARVRWNLVFIWQAPTMMMSYSIIGFLVGLVVYVTAPLYNQESFHGSSKAAVVFLLCAGISGSMFMWCSFWGYRFEDPQTRIF